MSILHLRMLAFLKPNLSYIYFVCYMKSKLQYWIGSHIVEVRTMFSAQFTTADLVLSHSDLYLRGD